MVVKCRIKDDIAYGISLNFLYSINQDKKNTFIFWKIVVIVFKKLNILHIIYVSTLKLLCSFSNFVTDEILLARGSNQRPLDYGSNALLLS